MQKFIEIKIRTKAFQAGYSDTLGTIFARDVNDASESVTDYNYHYDEIKPQYYRVVGTVKGFDRVKSSAADLALAIFNDITKRRKDGNNGSGNDTE